MKIINFSYLFVVLFFFSACTKDKLDTELLMGHWDIQEMIINGRAVVFDASIPLILKEEDQYTKSLESGSWFYNKKENTLSLNNALTDEIAIYTINELSLNEMRLEIEYKATNGETLHTIEVYYKIP